MGLKTDESSIHVLPPDEKSHKSTTATVESNLLDKDPDLYVKRAEYFARKGMLAEAENEYDAAILFSHKAGKYYDRKGCFYRDFVQDMKKASSLFNLALYKRLGWIPLALIGGNMIAAGLGYPFSESSPAAVLGLFILLAGVLNFARNFESGFVWFGMEVLMLGTIAFLYRKLDTHYAKVWEIALNVAMGIAVLMAIVFAFMAVGQLFSRIKRGAVRFFSKKQMYSDEELDAMGVLEPTPLEEVRRICRKDNLTTLRMLLVRALIMGVILVVLHFVSGDFKLPRFSGTANRVVNTSGRAEEADRTEPDSIISAFPDEDGSKTPVVYMRDSGLSWEEEQALAAEQRPALIEYLGCTEDELWFWGVSCKQGDEPRAEFWYVEDYQTLSDSPLILLEDGTAAWYEDDIAEIYNGPDTATTITGTLAVRTIEENAFQAAPSAPKAMDARALSEPEQKALIAQYLGCGEDELTFYQTNQAQRMEFFYGDSGSSYLVFLLDDGTVAGHYEAEVPFREEGAGEGAAIPSANAGSGISSELYAVLSGKEPFINHGYYADMEEYQYCDGIVGYTAFGTDYVVTTGFSIVDMDGDGINEVVLWGSLESSLSRSVCTVLHGYGGEVYGEMADELQMWPGTLRENGIFRDGWDDYWRCRLTEEATYEIECVAYHYDTYYAVGEKEVTEKEYNEFEAQIETADYAEVYEFTPENIQKFQPS